MRVAQAYCLCNFREMTLVRPGARLGRIIPFIFLNFPLMLLAPENLAHRLVLLELTGTMYFRVCAIRSVRLPRVKNLGQFKPGFWGYD